MITAAMRKSSALLALALLTCSASAWSADQTSAEQTQGSGVETWQTPVRLGHSAAYYGIEPAQREASIRMVLAAGGLDRPRMSSSLGDRVAMFLLKMYNGGGGAPSDLVRPRRDIKQVLGMEAAEAETQTPQQ